jgi:hypothetical protein
VHILVLFSLAYVDFEGLSRLYLAELLLVFYFLPLLLTTFLNHFFNFFFASAKSALDFW